MTLASQRTAPTLELPAFLSNEPAGRAALAAAGQSLLPAIMAGDHYTGAMQGVVFGVWVFSLAVFRDPCAVRA